MIRCWELNIEAIRPLFRSLTSQCVTASRVRSVFTVSGGIKFGGGMNRELRSWMNVRVAVGLAVFVVALMCWYKMVSTKATNNIQPVAVEATVVTNKVDAVLVFHGPLEMNVDGSVVVHDKGATFTVVPTTQSSSAPVVPENPHLKK